MLRGSKKDDRMSSVLYIVIPCYNEEEVLPETSKRILDKLQRMVKAGICSDDSRILFVDDGSRDQTWSMIQALSEQDVHFGGVKLAHNRGHQNALLAGLMTAKDHCDAAISMDADLQDDIEVLDEFMERYHEGCHVVYGVRKERKTDTFFKRNSALAFYKVMNALGTKVLNNHADYRLMSKEALEGLAQYREVNLFLRGIVPEIGYKTAVVYYDRGERFAGESKYPLKKMISFAIEGISSFSVKPLKMISTIGILISLFSGFGLLYALISKICGVAVPGWTAIVCSIWLLGGVQLLCLGVLGGYVGKIYQEVKARPRYIIEKKILRRDEPIKDLQEGMKEN